MSAANVDAMITAVDAIRIAMRSNGRGDQVTERIRRHLEQHGMDGYHRLTEQLIKLNAALLSYAADQSGQDVSAILDTLELELFSRS